MTTLVPWARAVGRSSRALARQEARHGPAAHFSSSTSAGQRALDGPDDSQALPESSRPRNSSPRLAALRAADPAADVARFLGRTRSAPTPVEFPSSSTLPSPPASTPTPSALSSATTGAPPLVDRFFRRHTYLRISLTERCSLRCRYCMPAQGVTLQPESNLLRTEEIVRVATVLARFGVHKVRLTGGEPLVRKDAVDVVARLAQVPGIDTVAMTTNGLVLERNLPALRAAGLTHLNISLDTLRADRFRAITRREGHERVLRAIEAAATAGYDPVKVNCVLMKGVNEDELLDFVRWTEHKPVEVRFIEYMPFDDNQWSDAAFLPYREMKRRILHAFPSLERIDSRADPGEAASRSSSEPRDGRGESETAKRFRVPGFRGSLGFITSMSEHFCGDCNRLRLTADGKLKVCLFGAEEWNLRDLLRDGASDEDLFQTVVAALQRKHFKLGGHADMHELARSRNRPMILIGG